MLTRWLCLAFFLFASTLAQAGCNTWMRAGKPDEQYVINADGTVLDKKSGLLWLRCEVGKSGSVCQIGTSLEYDWQGALAAASSSRASGYGDWRLPNVKELGSLIEKTCNAPAVNSQVFPGIGSVLFWTSTPHADASEEAWVIDLGSGASASMPKTMDARVFLVRGGYY